MKVFTGLAERHVDFLIEDVCDVDDGDIEGDDWTRGPLLRGSLRDATDKTEVDDALGVLSGSSSR